MHPEVAGDVHESYWVWRRCVCSDRHRVVVGAAITIRHPEIDIMHACSSSPVPLACYVAEVREEVGSVATESRGVRIKIGSIVIHIDVLTKLSAPVGRVRDRDRVVWYLRVLRCVSGGECAAAAHIVGVDRDVAPSVRRERCIIPGGVCGAVMPRLVHAHVVGIRSVP